MTTATTTTTAPAAALSTTPAAIVGVAMMGATEAREYLKMLRWDLEAADQALTNFRARALDFAEREGWRALGYAGALEALQTELGAQHSKSYLSRILQAGEIERVLDLPIGQLPERTLRPLARLDTPAQQIAAYQAVEGKPTAAKVQAAVDQIKPPAPGWVCEGCGVTITDMKRPTNPICSTCAIRRQALPSADVQHQQTIMAILKGTHTPALIQQAYDHAAEIRDIDLHNKMIAVIDRATDAPDPAPRAASATVAAYDQQDRSDKAIIQEAIGMLSAARALLSSVSPGAAWRRDQAHQSITQESARAYLLSQHERMARFSPAGMLSQASFREALDHIAALLEVCK